jgi:hypothetical protein
LFKVISMKNLLFCLAVWFCCVSGGVAGGVPRAECFPIEKLPPHLQQKAEEMLLKAMDREALFTIVGGLKPISEGFYQVKWKLEAASSEGKLEEAQEILRSFRCGDRVYADMQVFKAPINQFKWAHAFIARTDSLEEKLKVKSDFWLRLGITPKSHPSMIMSTIENAPASDRYRGYGTVFGYPQYAVDFFVSASESEKATGQFVKRSFISLPTFSAVKGHYVWATPLGHELTAEDRLLQERAALILEAYRQRRELYIGPGKAGIVALLRDWFDDGTGLCDPSNALLSPLNLHQPLSQENTEICSSTYIPKSRICSPGNCRHGFRIGRLFLTK